MFLWGLNPLFIGDGLLAYAEFKDTYRDYVSIPSSSGTVFWPALAMGMRLLAGQVSIPSSSGTVFWRPPQRQAQVDVALVSIPSSSGTVFWLKMIPSRRSSECD